MNNHNLRAVIGTRGLTLVSLKTRSVTLGILVRGRGGIIYSGFSELCNIGLRRK